MALFISYSSQDRSTVDALTTALRRGQNQVWFDQELGGGDSWWNKILEQIRDCEVFIVALSNNWLQSKPSQSELRYARALNRPILPVRIGDVDSMRVNPLAALQIIDYRDPTVDAGIQLVTAVHALRSKPVPLPDPLPEEPPVPFGYITRLGNQMAEKELSPQQQLQLLVELRSGLDEDGDDPSARGDIAQLLRMLRLRHDVTYRTRSEIDNVLAEIEAKDGSPAGPSAAADAKAATAASAGTQPASAAAAPTTAPVGSATAGGPNKRLIIIGAAALAVIAVIAIVVVVATQGSGSKKAPATARPVTSAAPVPGAPVPPAPPQGASGRLDSVLLGAEQVATIMGAPSLEVSGESSQLRPDENLSNPACVGAFDPIRTGGYAGHNPTGVRGRFLHADSSYRVYEAAVSFETAGKAEEFVRASAEKWNACGGKSVELKENGKVGNWTFGNVAGAPPRITQLRTLGDPDRPACERVLSAVSDVVLDVMACEVGVADQGGQIADQMAANLKS
jgi:serine/threonine kinase PknH